MGAELSGDAARGVVTQNEMDEFTETLVPQIIGECVRSHVYAWCGAHRSRWPRSMTCCLHRRDMEGFADQVLHAWERRERTEQDPTTQGSRERHE